MTYERLCQIFPLFRYYINQDDDLEELSIPELSHGLLD